jgi:hypothetical protein
MVSLLAALIERLGNAAVLDRRDRHTEPQGKEACVIQRMDQPSSELVCLEDRRTTSRCVTAALAGQLPPLSNLPPVHMIVINSPRPSYPRHTSPHGFLKTHMTRPPVIQKSLSLGMLTILLAAQPPPFGASVPSASVGSYNLLNLRVAYKFWQEKEEAGYLYA